MPEPENSKLKSCRQIRYKEAVTPVLGNFNHPLPAFVPDKNLEFFHGRYTIWIFKILDYSNFFNFFFYEF